MNIFVFTAGNDEAQQHLKDTIERSVPENVLDEHLTSEEFTELKRRAGGNGYYCWGAVPGEKNIPNWNHIQPGDYILSYWKKNYHHLSSVIYKVRNKELAAKLWGTNPDGETWELMYFLTKPTHLDPPLSSVQTAEYLQNTYQGFARIKPEKTERIMKKFDSLENFVAMHSNKIESDSGPVLKKSLSEKEVITHVHDYIESRGFQYKKDEISNFYLSLRTKPFVILAGISGTGKTQLPRKFAEALGFSKEQVIQLPVRPDWTDGSELLGYTSLEGNFVPKELILAINKAASNKDLPYFFILDEMNLARVEHYFSDFLSIIETRERKDGDIFTDFILREETLVNAKNKEQYKSVGWPSNLFLIGTVNMDETTNAFSKKVLDRANTIEMNEVDLNWPKTNNGAIKPLSYIPDSFFKINYLYASELTDEDKNGCKDNIALLIKINKELEKAGLHFGYRIRDEIAFYLVYNKKLGLLEDKTAFDFQVVQKILPRIHGSSERIPRALIGMLNILEKLEINNDEFSDSSLLEIERRLNVQGKLQYPNTTAKIMFMLRRYEEDRFTSFWL